MLSWLNDYLSHVLWSVVIVSKSGTRAGADPASSWEKEYEPVISAWSLLSKQRKSDEHALIAFFASWINKGAVPNVRLNIPQLKFAQLSSGYHLKQEKQRWALKWITFPLTCSQCSASNCSNLEGQAMHVLSMDHGCQLVNAASGIHSLEGHEAPVRASQAEAALLPCYTYDWAGWGVVHFKEKFPDSWSLLSYFHNEFALCAVCVFSLGWLCGTAGETLETDLLLKQNNKSEQISHIIVGSDKNNFSFHLYISTGLLKRPCPTPSHPARLFEGQERTQGAELLREIKVFMYPITFPHYPKKNFFPPLLLQGNRRAEHHSPGHSCMPRSNSC